MHYGYHSARPTLICYLDDILITGKSNAQHMANLETVLKQLKEHEVRLNKDKCQCFEDAVEYVGHRADAQGVHTSTKKLKAILEAPKPRNVQEPRSCLGLISAYPGNHAPSSQCAPSQWPTMEMVARMHSGIPGS